jgi:hypothetical protein
MAISTPTAESVRTIVGGLFDRELTIDTIAPVIYSANVPMTIAVYTNDAGTPQALFLCDVGLAAHAAAALVLLPVNTSQACADGGYISDELIENYHEVANVASGLFVDTDGSRVSLRELIAPGSPIPKDVRPLLAMPGGRTAVEMDIEGYGRGRMLLHSA